MGWTCSLNGNGKKFLENIGTKFCKIRHLEERCGAGGNTEMELREIAC
jgi:hypothetical protein